MTRRGIVGPIRGAPPRSSAAFALPWAVLPSRHQRCVPPGQQHQLPSAAHLEGFAFSRQLVQGENGRLGSCTGRELGKPVALVLSRAFHSRAMARTVGNAHPGYTKSAGGRGRGSCMEWAVVGWQCFATRTRHPPAEGRQGYTPTSYPCFARGYLRAPARAGNA
jgi:hypothetical protein